MLQTCRAISPTAASLGEPHADGGLPVRQVAPLVGRVTALHRWLDLTPWAFFNHVQTVLFAFW